MIAKYYIGYDGSRICVGNLDQPTFLINSPSSGSANNQYPWHLFLFKLNNERPAQYVLFVL